MLRTTIAAAILIILAGCAGGGSEYQVGGDSAAPDPDRITVRVNNEFDGTVVLTPVWLPDAGLLRMGELRGGRREQFSIAWNPGILRVMVRGSGERRVLLSNQLLITESDRGGNLALTIHWDFRATLERW
jgi:hypothetical protein